MKSQLVRDGPTRNRETPKVDQPQSIRKPVDWNDMTTIPFRIAMVALLVATSSFSVIAADFTIEQIRQALATATAENPADFSGKDLSRLDLSNVDFKGANLVGTSLFASRLVSANLAGADLSRANLNGAWLMGTNFEVAKLVGSSLLSLVILGGEVKERPNFAGADLSGARRPQ